MAAGSRTEPVDQPQPSDRPLAFDPLFDRKLADNENATFGALGHYRRLARALQGLQTEAGLRRLLVTSALPAEGRTFTVTNLALALSEFFKQRVLLIDADVRNPSIGTNFKLAGERGLSDVLLAKSEDLPLHAVSRNLAVMTAGRPDPNTMAALTSDRMEWLVGQFASHFDWVLLDAAPVEFMTDSTVASSSDWVGSFRDRRGRPRPGGTLNEPPPYLVPSPSWMHGTVYAAATCL